MIQELVPIYPMPPDPGLLDLPWNVPNHSTIGAGENVDSAIVYLDLQVTSLDIFNVPCLIIGEGEAQLRWTASDDFLRWLGSDADLRWGAEYRVGTGHC